MDEMAAETRQRLGLAILAAALALIAFRALPDVWRQRPFGIEVGPFGEGSVRLRDFSSHARMAHLALERGWRHGDPVRSLYAPETHQLMMREWTDGRADAVALPFGYSPTMVWLLTPFARWPDQWAYLLWSLAGLGLVAWMAWPRDDWPLVAGLVFLSPLVVRAFELGQTAVFSNAALLLLALPLDATQRRGGWRVLLDAGLLWLLTAKPPVAILAGGALLAVGRWRAVALAVTLTLITTALAHPLLGPGWIGDYLTLARTYNSEEASRVFAWCLEPTYMGNLRAGLWQLGLTDRLACQVTGAGWLLATAALVVAGLRGWVAPWAVWCLGVLAFLLLSPHVNVTEDVQLHTGAVVAFAALRGSTQRIDRLWPGLFVACLWMSSLKDVAPAALWPWAPLLAKVALAALLVWRAAVPHRAAVDASRRE